MTTIKYFSMFTGIGGFEYAIQQADSKRDARGSTFIADTGDEKKQRFSCIGYSEINRHAIAIFRHHYPDLKNYGNAREIDPLGLPDFDILCGGFSCQSFSIAGKRAGFEDTRGTLFHEICRIAQSKRPRILFLENVLGLLSADDGRCFATIISSLDELGYDVEWQVLDSQNFGVPQHRERVFIVGHLRGQSSRQIFPLGEADQTNLLGERGSEPKAKPASTIGTREGNQKENNFIVLQPSIDILGNIYPSQHQAGNIYSPEGIAPTLKCEGVRPNAKNQAPKIAINRLGGLYGQVTRWGVYDTEGLSPTITKAMGDGGGHIPLIPSQKIIDVSHIRHEGIREYDEVCPTLNTVGGGGHLPLILKKHGANEVRNQRIRRLTPVECERLQGFPDDWTKFGINEKGGQYIISDSQRYKCLGNAVTTKVITAIAEKLLEAF